LQFCEGLISKANSDSMSVLEAADKEDSAGSTVSVNRDSIARNNSIKRKDIVRKALSSMTDAPLFIILDFR